MGDYFFEVTELFCFQSSYCPVKEGNQAASSRNKSDYFWRGTQTIFPLLAISRFSDYLIDRFTVV